MDPFDCVTAGATSAEIPEALSLVVQAHGARHSEPCGPSNAEMDPFLFRKALVGKGLIICHDSLEIPFPNNRF